MVDEAERMSGMEPSRILNLILIGQEHLQERVTEVRVEVAAMKSEIRNLTAGQQDLKQDLCTQAANVKFDLQGQRQTVKENGIRATAEEAPAVACHSQDHKDLWAAINKLTTLSKAMSISGGVLMTVLTALVIILGLLK